MRWQVSIGSGVGILLVAGTAVASDADWSLGGGIGLRTGLGGTYVLGTLLGPSLVQLGSETTPTGALLLERHLGRSWALVGSVTAGYSQSRRDGAVSSLDAELSTALGVRWIVNPRGGVQISPLVALAAGWSRAYARMGSSRTRLETYSTSVVVGVVLERELAEGLFLRLESPLVDAGYHWGRQATTLAGTTEDDELAGLGARLALAPSLQLRLRF